PPSTLFPYTPLFRSCHVDGAAEGGYRVDTPTAAARAGESGWTGRLVVPGDPEQSLLYRKLVDRRPPVGQQMPLLRTPLDDRAREDRKSTRLNSSHVK